jgi:hypothetical protein
MSCIQSSLPPVLPSHLSCRPSKIVFVGHAMQPFTDLRQNRSPIDAPVKQVSEHPGWSASNRQRVYDSVGHAEPKGDLPKAQPGPESALCDQQVLSHSVQIDRRGAAPPVRPVCCGGVSAPPPIIHPAALLWEEVPWEVPPEPSLVIHPAPRRQNRSPRSLAPTVDFSDPCTRSSLKNWPRAPRFTKIFAGCRRHKLEPNIATTPPLQRAAAAASHCCPTQQQHAVRKHAGTRRRTGRGAEPYEAAVQCNLHPSHLAFLFWTAPSAYKYATTATAWWLLSLFASSQDGCRQSVPDSEAIYAPI